MVLVSIDTLRADRLGSYGWKEAETPVLDALTREGTRFAHVYAPVPMTLPSHTTMLTGLEPPVHGQRDNGMASAELGAPTLAERLAAAGWDTGGFVAAFVLNRTFGLDRGFATFDDGPPQEREMEGLFRGVAPGNERVDRALAWLAVKRERPFFLFLHLYDVHAPHVPPPGFERRFASSPYDGEVAFVDGQVGRVLHVLEARGLAKETLVVVTADHGEGLGEHGEETHGVLLYDSTLHVPLIVRLPGRVPRGAVVSERAGLVDVTPTILDLAGLPPDPALQGRPLFARERAGERLLWAETLYPQRAFGWAKLTSVRRGALKYVEAPRPELYDTDRDPAEGHDLAAERPREAAALRDLAAATQKELASRAHGAARGPDAEARAKLGALGYLSGPARAGEAGLDPKDGIASIRSLGRAYDALDRGDLEEAERLFRQETARFPKDAGLLSALGKVLELRGREEEARAAYREALRHDADAPIPLARLFELAARRGDRQERLEVAERLVAAYPRNASSWRMRAQARAELARDAEAEADFREALRREPASFTARLRWAEFLASRGRRGEAAPLVDALAKEAPDSAEVRRLRAPPSGG